MDKHQIETINDLLRREIITIPNFPTNHRASGRTAIIIADGIARLLKTGIVLVTEHFYEESNHRPEVYIGHVIPRFYEALSSLLYLNRKQTWALFPYELKYKDGMCIGFMIKATNKGQFQY